MVKSSSCERNVSSKRITLAQQALLENKTDAMIFFDGDRYGRKFANTAAFTALVLFPKSNPIVVAHSIEKDHAESESELETVELRDTAKLRDLLKHLVPKTTTKNRPKVAVIPWTASFEKVRVLQELSYEVIDASKDILLRCLKKPFPEEIETIRRLSTICDKGLEAANDAVEVGRLEYEVAAEVDYAVKKLGVTEFNFPTLVASGYRAAFPHGWTSSKEIRRGEVVVVDIGPILDDYDGCVCRTFTTTDRKSWKKETEVVQEAIHRSLNILEKNKTAKAARIDKIARETIRKQGYTVWPNMKTVWTGHPIGGFSAPTIAPYSKDEIEKDMTFTIEPGIYIKGKGGVRIEHHVLAKAYGYEILDRFPENP